jgi:hypothetical protein
MAKDKIIQIYRGAASGIDSVELLPGEPAFAVDTGKLYVGLSNGTNKKLINPDIPAATASAIGGLELFSDTVQSVAANSVSGAAGKTYGVQLNSDGQAVVNVPWTDNNTIYGALDQATATAGTETTGKLITAKVLSDTIANKATAIVEGLAFIAPCRVATTANITLSGTQTIDGVAVVAGDRVLVKDQTTASQNGVYTVAASAWSRALDANATGELHAGSTVYISAGAVNGDTGWMVTTDGTITLDTTAIAFAQISGAGAVKAGNGLTLSGNTLNVAPATSTVVGGVELFSDTVQSVAAAAVSATASRTYGLQLNSNGQAVVNVPWTNTTYSNTSVAEATTGTDTNQRTVTGQLLKQIIQNFSGALATTAGTSPAFTLAQTGFVLFTGARVTAKLHAASVASMTLNVNNTGAKPVFSSMSNAAIGTVLPANGVFDFVYDGTNWIAVVGDNDNTTYTAMGLVEFGTGTTTTDRLVDSQLLSAELLLSQGAYAVCATAAATAAKAVTMLVGGITNKGVSTALTNTAAQLKGAGTRIQFTNGANTTVSSTLAFNGGTAIPINWGTTSIVNANSFVDFVCDGTNWVALSTANDSVIDGGTW